MNTLKLYIFNTVTRILPPSRCNNLKVRLLRWAGAKVGNNVKIFTPRILGNFNLEIGDNVWLGHEPLIFGASGSTIHIGNHAKIGSRAIIVTGYHDFSIKYDNVAGPGKWDNVYISAGSAIDSQAMILPGKTIGEKAHVSAGSVVTHDVPAFTRVAGVPARIIKNFKNSE